MTGPLKNPRHESFAQFVAIGKSATEAYVAAGFSPGKDGNQNRGAAQSASRLLQNVGVKSRIAELSAEVQQSTVSKARLNREFVLDALKRNYERAMELEEVRDKEGRVVGLKWDGAVANRALELMGKELGMFRDRSQEVSVKDALERASPAELQALITEYEEEQRARGEELPTVQ